MGGGGEYSVYTENRVKGLKVAKWHKRRQKAREKKKRREMKELEGKRGEMKQRGRRGWGE